MPASLRIKIIYITAILFLGTVAYWNTFHYGFVYDDFEFIVLNPFIKNFSEMHGFWDMGFPKTRLLPLYSFAFNYAFGKLDPFWFHLSNFGIHVITTFMVWCLVSVVCEIVRPVVKVVPVVRNRKTKKPTKAVTMASASVDTRSFDHLRSHIPYLVALLFMVHPMQTQAVTYVTQRFASMVTFFYVSSLFFYLKARISDRYLWHKITLFILSLVCSGLGLMSKEVILSLPIMVVASEFLLLYGGRGERRRFVTKKNLMIASGLGAFFFFVFVKLLGTQIPRLFAVRLDSQSHDGDVLTTGTYLLTQCRVFLTFCRLMVFPSGQNLEYDFPMSTGLLSPFTTLIGLVLIVGFVIAIFKAHKEYPLITFGLAWMLITFSVNLVPRANVIFEHKLYLVGLGGLIAFVGLLSRILSHRKGVIAITVVVACVLSVVTYQRNRVWENEQTLWEDVVQKAPGKARVQANLGKLYIDLREYDKALRHLNEAIRMKPEGDHKSYTNRGSVYYYRHEYDKAMADHNKAIQIAPNYFGSYINRALLFSEQGYFNEALNDLNRAIALDPKFQFAYISRGHLLRQMGRLQEALIDLNMALRIAPYDVNALIARAIVHYQLKNNEQSLADFDQALEIDPNQLDGYLNRGFFYLQTKHVELAFKDFNRAIQIAPNNPAGYNKRALAYVALEDLHRALLDLEKALELDPGDANARNNRQAILQRMNKGQAQK